MISQKLQRRIERDRGGVVLKGGVAMAPQNFEIFLNIYNYFNVFKI